MENENYSENLTHTNKLCLEEGVKMSMKLRGNIQIQDDNDDNSIINFMFIENKPFVKYVDLEPINIFEEHAKKTYIGILKVCIFYTVFHF